jgi:predicted metal-dependent phosphoesterase TrpH
MAQTRIVQYDAAEARHARTVVSLHSHTSHSREVLTFLPGWAARTPVARFIVRRELRRHEAQTGGAVDFSRGYWRPPLSPKQVFDSEVAQAADRFGAPALVSITDHDEIAANLALVATGLGGCCPVSTEWTVPYRGSIFHLGIHNLPPESAAAMMHEFQACTANPSEPLLEDLLAWVHSAPSTLIVLNHPLWNARLDVDQSTTALAAFVAAHRQYLHATEINGYRRHAENKAVIRLAREWDLPVLAGGDRHGRAANAMLNLTASTTFDEFVDEVRRGGIAHTVVMPEYREHTATRVMAVVSDVLSENGLGDPLQRHWTQRVFVIREDGRHQSLAEFWAPNVPLAVRACASVAVALGRDRTRQALRLGLPVEDGGLL